VGIASASQILKVPGALFTSVTSLTGSAPYGGTAIGEVRNRIFRPGVKVHKVAAEEWGGQTCEVLYGATVAVFGCVLRSWDADALRIVFPCSEDGASGEALVLYQPAADDDDTFRPGRALASSYGVPLTFVPRAPAAHSFVHLYNAVPAVEETAELQFGVSREIGLAVMWHGLPDDQGRVFAQGRREDITL
jgi:hypothetical protein